LFDYNSGKGKWQLVRVQMLSVLIGRDGRVERYTMNDSPAPVKQGVTAEHAE